MRRTEEVDFRALSGWLRSISSSRLQGSACRPLIRVVLLAAIVVAFGSCSSSSEFEEEDGSSGSGRVATDLYCQDGVFWAECIVTWSDGSQQKAGVIGILGVQTIGTRSGEVVASFEFINSLGQAQCLKLYEGGAVEDCYQPNLLFGGSSSGSSTGRVSPTVPPTTTTIVLEPARIKLGNYQYVYLGSIGEIWLPSGKATVKGSITLTFPVTLVNSKLEEVCMTVGATGFNGFLYGPGEHQSYLKTGSIPFMFGKSSCSKFEISSEQNIESVNNIELTIYFDLSSDWPGYPDGRTGIQDLRAECMLMANAACRSIPVMFEFRTASGVSDRANLILDLIVNNKAEGFLWPRAS